MSAVPQDAAGQSGRDDDFRYVYKPSLMGAAWELRLRPDALEWRTGRHHGRIPYDRITRIRLSFLALMVYGASDAVSVVIRQSLVQMRTPYDMLGRVMAVNSMFTGSSGSLGEFRAGSVAAWLGAVPSALIGGAGAIMVMLIWMWAFPQLRRVDKLTPEAPP